MKKINRFERKPLARWIAMSLVSASLSAVVGSGPAFAAAPLAGTEIKNLATVSYQDENGNTYTAQSNEAIITVAEQFRATLENDRIQSAAPGQTVYFPHTLVNTGNTGDTYALQATNNATIYLDTNGNGQPDPGENAVTSVTLASGETAQLIVAYSVSPSAANNTSENITLTATSSTPAGIVKDIGTNTDGDADDDNATNSDIVNITTGPVLVLNKEATFDAANSKVTYTLTVKNTGGSDAKLVDIIDGIPLVDHDNDAATPKLPLTGLTIDSVNGILASNGDTIPAGIVQVSEVDYNEDLNGDGDATDTVVDAVKATDLVLAPNTTVSVVYSANYDATWRAGADIENTFVAARDDDNDPATPKVTSTSNTTHNVIPQTYGVDANDDKVNPAVPSPGINDGKDDDGNFGDDTQYVDVVSAGEEVVFTHTITNTGNGDDTFNLDVANTDFPAGTIFTFWNADGTVKLTDSDGGGIPDTGVIGQNETATIVVKATLPAGASGNASYNAVLTATSSSEPTVSNPTNLKLGSINPPSVDLAAVTSDTATDTIATNHSAQTAPGFNDGGAANAHDEGPVALANDVPIGSVVSFPMSVANESGSSDSFLLETIDLPTGWTVEFKDENNQVISATPYLPAGGTFNYTAYVTLSTDPVQSAGDSPRATDVDGYDGINDGVSVLTGADGDKDYVIEFKVTSASNPGRTDSVKHVVDVKDNASVTITPDGQNQIQPGGTVDYPHRLQNTGNVNEALEIASENSDPAWNSTTLIDTDGDGVGDTELDTLTDGAVIKVFNDDGSITDATLTDTDGDGVVEFPLTPGQYVKLTNKVFAPADAPQGAVNSTTLTALDPGVAQTARNVATDTSTVILGQVRLEKTVAYQQDCTTPPLATDFAAIQSNKVEPGECAVWQIIATNEGTAKVKNVIINDNIPEYTSSVGGTLKYCEGLACIPGVITDAADNDAGQIVNDLVTFYVGAASDPSTQLGGELGPGESATVRFTVKVDE